MTTESYSVDDKPCNKYIYLTDCLYVNDKFTVNNIMKIKLFTKRLLSQPFSYTETSFSLSSALQGSLIKCDTCSHIILYIMIRFSINKIVFHSLFKNLLLECEICISPIQLKICNGQIYKTIFWERTSFGKRHFKQFNSQMNI